MRKYRKILVPYDGTLSTEYTLRMACRMARMNDSHVLVVVPFFGQAEAAAEQEDISSGISLISRQEKVPMDVIFKDGRPSDTIIVTSQDQGNDLIVLGKNEMNSLERFVVGSITARIMGHTTGDLLIVPEDRLIRWNRLLLCTDGSHFSDGAIENAIAYGKSFGSEVYALYVVEFNNEFLAFSPEGVKEMAREANRHLQEIVDYAAGVGVSVTPYVREGDRSQRIVKVARETRADVVFMGSRRRSGFGRLLMGSVARDVAMGAGVPVFIIKEKNGSVEEHPEDSQVEAVPETLEKVR